MTKAFERANLIQQAKQALLAGDSARAKLLAEQLLLEDPSNSDAKLILAGLSGPESSLKLVQEALESDPNNPFAHKALQWAGEQSRQKSASQWQTLPQAETVQADLDKTAPIPVFVQRIETKTPQKVEQKQETIDPKTEEAPKKRKSLLPYALLLLAALIGFVLYSTGIIRTRPVAGQQFLIKNDTAKLLKPSLTPTKTSVPTATPSPTATNTPEPSPTPTEIPTATPTEVVIPTVLVEPVVYEPEPWDEPGGEEDVYVQPASGKWIDINLSSQILSAYENEVLVNSFLVSTGRPGNETVTGTYYVYVKHLYADMAGPGYYLADVPYVMYFYLGYGIHGTYWHDNFGTPMSAGCINMETGAAAWLYNWAFVGIPVSVHY